MTTAATLFDLTGARVYVAGHRGMVGRALLRRLEQEPVTLLTAGREELDLTRQDAVERWMTARRPDVVIVAAARVGGILANSTHPVEFLEENLKIETNLIGSAHRAGTRKLLFLGSSCIYPKHSPQPMREEALLTGTLEPTNQWYAIAKIAGIMLARAYRREFGADFISAMPTNIYGPHDNFDLTASHVVPAMIRKMHDARLACAPEVEIWGTGAPRREFLHVDDLADACLFLLRHYSGEEHLNVGCGEDLTIADLAAAVREVVGFGGALRFDPTKPDGAPRKLLDTRRLTALGWRPRVDLHAGLADAYAWFQANPARGLAHAA